MKSRLQRNSAHGERGNSILEFALVVPVLLYLVFIPFDLGLHIMAMTEVENAARAAAARNSTGLESATDQETACSMALSEMQGLPGVPTSSSCNGQPLQVKSVLCNSSTPCTGSETSPDGGDAAAVTVTYTMPVIFRFPIAGPDTIVRTCRMKVRTIQ